jgi:hypothetical protein
VTTTTWYVTFETRKRGLRLFRERSPRLTRTFATEADAKAFACSKLEEGLVVFAGTVNPSFPKRLVLPRDMASWIEEGAIPSNELKCGKD